MYLETIKQKKCSQNIPMLNDYIFSVLQFCELFSTRNITIIGVSFLMGLMIPQWLIENEAIVKTGVCSRLCNTFSNLIYTPD